MEEEQEEVKNKAIDTVKQKNHSIVDWMIVLLLSAVPIVNIIIWCIWATDTYDKEKKNFAIAQLLLSVIPVVILSILIIVFSDIIANRVY